MTGDELVEFVLKGLIRLSRSRDRWARRQARELLARLAPEYQWLLARLAQQTVGG